MAKAGTLASDFAAAPTGLTLSGSASVTGGQLVLPTTNPYSVGSFAGVDFTSTFVYVQVVTAGGVSGTRQNSIKIVVDASNSIEMMLSGGTFRGRKQVAAANTDTPFPTYSATTHAWWRIREASGTVYWDTSPDGVTWTNLGSTVHGLTLTSVTLNFQSGYYGAVGSETGAANSVYDNLNWQIVTDTAQGTSRVLDTSDTYQAVSTPNITVTDSADTARAYGSVDAAVQPVTLVDPAVGGARGFGAVDAAVQPVTLTDPVGRTVRAFGAVDTVQGSDSLDPGGSSQAVAVGQPDTVAIGVVVVDPGAGAARAVSGTAPETEVGSTSGTLSNLPILRVLADFTQGPPNQPASTAGGTTVELTQSLAATQVTVRRGRQYELGKPQAGTAVITFSDPKELLNPTNTSSSYNSGSASLVSYRPMRITAVWRGTLYTIYTGYIERYPQTWTDAGFRGIKPLECVDGLAMLANTATHQSYFETIMADNPAVYIPYNEAAAPANVYLTSSKALLANGSSLPGNPRQGTSTYYQTQLLVGGTALRTVASAGQGAQVSFGGDTMPDGTPALTLSSKSKDPASTDTSRATARIDTAGGTFSVNTNGSTIECWFRWTVGTANIMVCESVTDGEFDYATADALVGLFTITGGRLGFAISGTGSDYQWVEVSSSFSSYTGYPDGQWHYAAMTFSVNGSGNVRVTCTLDYSETYFDSKYPPSRLGVNSVHTHATSEFSDPEAQVSVAQFAYYPTPLTQTQRTTHANRGFGYNNETAYGRFTRLINTYWKDGAATSSVTPDIRPILDTDFVYGVYPVPGNAAKQSAQNQSYTVQQAIQMVDVATQGMSYFDVNGNPTHEPRNYRISSTTSLGTFSDRPGDLPYVALEFDYDPTYVYTRTQVTKAQGGQAITNDNTTAQANYGVRTFSDTVQLYNEFDLFQFGMHILTMYGTQRVRIRRIEIDPAADGTDALWKIVLGLELSQRFTVKRHTADGTLFSKDYFVEQIEHQVDPASSTWKVALQLSPVLYSSAPGVANAADNTGKLGTGTVVTF